MRDGAAKPVRALAFDVFGTPPEDLAGARAAELRTAFVERPLGYGPGSSPRADPDADASVSDLRAPAARLA